MIHKTVKIGKYCCIAKDVLVGKNTIIGNYVEINSGTVIGENCYIGHYSIIDNSILKNNVKLQGQNRIGSRCVLDNDVVMKYQSIITSDAFIEESVFIGVGAVTLGSDIDGDQIPDTVIGKGSYIGGQAIVAPGLKVPSFTILGANSYLRKIEESGTYVGSPAKKAK